MPLLSYRCIFCGVASKKLVDMGAKPEFTCSCGGKLERYFGAGSPTVQVVERLDNGAMGKAVERLADAERLFRDRSKKDNVEQRERLGYRDTEE